MAPAKPLGKQRIGERRTVGPRPSHAGRLQALQRPLGGTGTGKSRRPLGAGALGAISLAIATATRRSLP
jgi:hypothetical protein